MKAVCGKVKADVADYTQCMCDEFPVNLAKMRNVSSPAASHPCKARDDAEKMSKSKAEIFHNMVARGLFSTKRSRGNIHTATSFSRTRVQLPDTDGCKKLVCLMKHLHQTVKLVPKLRVKGLSIESGMLMHPMQCMRTAKGRQVLF